MRCRPPEGDKSELQKQQGDLSQPGVQ